MNFLLAVTRFLAIAILPLAVMSVGLQGVVGCFGGDGAFALEMGCSCAPDDQDESNGADQSELVNPSANGGADCICVPLSSEWQTTVASSKQNFYPKETLPLPFTSLAFVHPEPASIAWPVTPNRTVEPSPPFFHLALRTIILLT